MTLAEAGRCHLTCGDVGPEAQVIFRTTQSSNAIYI
jgi:hypothetical protein